MPTGQQVANRALITLALLEQGGSASTSDSNAAIDELNAMWQSWSIDEGLIYGEVILKFPVVAGKAFYTIGLSGGPDVVVTAIPSRVYNPGYFTLNLSGGTVTASILPGSADLPLAVVSDGGTTDLGVITIAGLPVGASLTIPGSSVVLPDKVSLSAKVTAPNTIQVFVQNLSGSSQTLQAATYSVQAIVTSGAPGTGQSRNPVKIVNGKEGYFSHRDLSATALSPDELYVDFEPDADGFIRVYNWPISSALSAFFELITSVPFVNWVLGTNYNIPPGYADTINWALAYRLIPSYGEAIDPKVLKVIEVEGPKAELRLRTANKVNRQLQPGTEQLTPPQAPGKGV